MSSKEQEELWDVLKRLITLLGFTEDSVDQEYLDEYTSEVIFVYKHKACNIRITLENTYEW